MGNYTRTFNRHDYSFMPSKKILDKLQEKNIEVISAGKINDIFSGKGISKHCPSSGDANGMDITIYLATEKSNDKKLIFTNLVQFDSHYGHRRDVEGYANNINLFDIKLAKLINVLDENDLLIITSNHGNDLTFKCDNHTREALPATIYSKAFKNPRN